MSRADAAQGRTDAVRASVREQYARVARAPKGHFPYPIGRESALGLGYLPEWVDAVPREVTERFVGVGNPFSIARPGAGARVLDAGCGGGFDAYVASALVGPSGRVVGIDLTAEMLAVARAGLAGWPLRNLEFVEGSVEALPFEDGCFDLVVSNGVLNLVPDKDRAYREIHRVLRPGGDLAIADVLAVAEIPEAVVADPRAWCT